MKKSLKERAQEFWAKHKYTILLVGGMTLVGLLGYAANKAEQEEEKELADIQKTTLRTVQRHLANIRTKTDVKSLVELSTLFNKR